MDRNTDIREINRELRWLCARYAGFAWAAGLMASLASIFPAAALMLFMKVTVFDMLYGAFFVLTLAIALTAPPRPRAGSTSSRNRRSLSTIGISPRPAARRTHSEAELIEWQIGERERRLKELRAEAE